MAYDEESLFAGIAIGKSMKGWSRAPAQSSNRNPVGTIPLTRYPYSAKILPCLAVLGVPVKVTAIVLANKETTQADYLEVT